MTGLRDQQVLASRTPGGRVICPPLEYDPESGEPVDDLVEVADRGEVTGWTWVAEPLADQPLDHPFAWALIRLDGADTSMVHAVDGGEIDAMSTGMRVQVRWAPERTGHITDIACFEPEETS